MHISKQIKLNLSAIVLLAALLLPTTVQLLHSLENHKHTACGEVTTHLHEKSFDCSIGSFHFFNFSFEPSPLLSQIVSETFSNNKIGYFSSEIIGYQNTIFLRGPPAIS